MGAVTFRGGEAFGARNAVKHRVEPEVLRRREHEAFLPHHTVSERRLNSAIATFPDSARAAIQQLPLDSPGDGFPLLAQRIHENPIDGVMLFPTSACRPGECPDCEVGDCENCLPPDLTPRTAYMADTVVALLPCGRSAAATEPTE